jgi:hypothetical protein
MPEHVHLLLSEPQRETLADARKSLKQARHGAGLEMPIFLAKAVSIHRNPGVAHSISLLA